MSQRSDIAPETLQVSLEPEGVEVEYVDGRSVFYHGVPAKQEGSVVCPPGKDVHVLVTSPDGEEGVMVYVNDRNTHDDILRSTGVGRVILDRDEETSLFPGVEARNHGYRVEVTADPETARGRVFVFAEDERSESAYELVAAEEDEPTDGDDGPPERTDEAAVETLEKSTDTTDAESTNATDDESTDATDAESTNATDDESTDATDDESTNATDD